jgi:hypothetical protein
VGKDTDWVELIIEPGGSYEGTMFIVVLLVCVLDHIS